MKMIAILFNILNSISAGIQHLKVDTLAIQHDFMTQTIATDWWAFQYVVEPHFWWTEGQKFFAFFSPKVVFESFATPDLT